jgi:iron complex outermembrane receptor protein
MPDYFGREYPMRKIRALAVASVSLIAFATPVMAQDVPAKDGDQSGIADNEIIVTARRRDESIQDVPSVVQALPAAQLQNLNIRDFKDIQSLVPGMSMGQDANGIGNRTTLRGVAYDVNASGNNGTVEFYLNDAPLSAGILFQSMFDVGQIEVLRGPQGTLRGRASPSGSVTVTTHRPDMTEPGGYVNGTVNSIGGWNVQAAINVPVIADKVAVRVAGVVDENNDNRVDSINSSIDPSQKNRGIRASIAAEPFEPLSLFFSYTSTNRKVVNFNQVESANIENPALAASPVLIRAQDREAVASAPNSFDQTFRVFNWQAELRVAGQKLNYVGSHNTQHYLSNAPGDSGGFFGFAPFPTSVTTAGLRTDSHATQDNHEIRLSSDERIGGIFDYVVGALWNKLDSPTDLQSDTIIFAAPFAGSFATPATPPAVALFTPIQRTGGSKERSFFANVTAHIGDAFEISGGARRIKFNSTGGLFIGGVQSGALEDRTQHATIWSATAKYKVSQDITVYGNFGTSWRAGSSTNPVNIGSSGDVPTAFVINNFYELPPEKSKSYEIGFKSEWLDRRLTLNVAAYHQTFENFGYRAPGVIIATTNAGNNRAFTTPGINTVVPVKVNGVEGELSFRPTENWSMGVVASYSISKIKNGTIPCNDFFNNSTGVVGSDGITDVGTAPTYAQIIAATGGNGVALCQVSSRAGLSAPFSATVQSEYSLPIGDSAEGYLRGFVNYQGNSQNDPQNVFDDIKGYALVNLYAGVRDPQGTWDVGLYVKNVFDAERELTVNNNNATASYRTFAGAQTGVTSYRVVTMTAPREFGVNARIYFGSR